MVATSRYFIRQTPTSVLLIRLETGIRRHTMRGRNPRKVAYASSPAKPNIAITLSDEAERRTCRYPSQGISRLQ